MNVFYLVLIIVVMYVVVMQILVPLANDEKIFPSIFRGQKKPDIIDTGADAGDMYLADVVGRVRDEVDGHKR